MSKQSELARQEQPAAAAVLEWLLTGASEHQIAEALAAKFPTADGAQLMQTVQQYLRDAGNPDSVAVRGWALLSYRRLYQQMLQVGDFNGCRQVIKEIMGILP